MKLIVFTLNQQRYALRLSTVSRVVWAVEIVPLPNAPDIVLGMINLQGQIVPVVDIRKRFNLPPREMELADHLIIAHTARRAVALWVDGVTGLFDFPDEQLVASEKILPGLEHVQGVVKFADGMIFVHDIDRFLSLDEEQALDGALKVGGLGGCRLPLQEEAAR